MNDATRTALMSHTKDDWQTPGDLLAQLDREFDFVLDAAACSTNHVVPLWLGEGGLAPDALAVDWAEILRGREMGSGAIWCNPPYGRNIGDWLHKGHDAMLEGYTVVFLLPARTDTQWFHAFVERAGVEVRFLKGRVRFGGASAGAPFPSLLLIFRPAALCEPYSWQVCHVR